MTLGPPLQPLRCAKTDCTLPAGGRCAREAEFPDPLVGCTELARAPEVEAPAVRVAPASQKQEPKPVAEDFSEAAPWRGRHLNREEASSLLYRSPALLLPVLGARNAGKTCLLASFFLQLASGQREGFPYRFASSRSLYGFFDLIERARRWNGMPDTEIVPHSPLEGGDHIGRLLHLGLCPEDPTDRRHLDLLLTDWPGEWLTEWAELDGDAAHERLPFLQQADGVLVLIDATVALSSEGAQLDAQTAQLIRRIAELVGPRKCPLSFVVTKMDRVLDRVRPPAAEARNEPAAWGELGRRLRRCWAALDEARSAGALVSSFPAASFPGTLDRLQPVNVVQPFAHAMSRASGRASSSAPFKPIGAKSSWFETMRRWGETDG